MAKNSSLLLFVTVFSVAQWLPPASSATVASGNSTLTAYDMLERYGFPRGILPEGVQRYELRAYGSFEVFLSGAGGCELRIADGYMLRYGRRVAGTAQAGSICALDGVSVKVWFAWLGITEVHRADDQLSFLVGPVTTSFPLSNFAYSPRCRYGRTGDAVAAS